MVQSSFRSMTGALGLAAGLICGGLDAGVRLPGGGPAVRSDQAWPGKLTPDLRARVVRPGEELDVLVLLRIPMDTASRETASLATATRRRLIRETGDELARLLTPFGVSVREQLTYIPVMHVRVPAELLGILAADERVASIEPVRVLHAMRPNGKAMLGVPVLASQGLDGAGVSVAVLDTGVDYRHPELTPGGTDAAAKTIKLWDAIDNDDDPMDANGHGTSVAGIIAGSVAGVAPKARIVAVRVLNAGGNSQSGSVLTGIDKVVESVANGNPHNIRAVNLSLGGIDAEYWPPNAGTCDELAPSYKAAFDTLLDLGVLVLVAAGNDGCATGVAYPACISSAVAVGAVYNTPSSSSGPWVVACGDVANGCTDAPAVPKQIACYSNSGDKLAVWAPADCTVAPDYQAPWDVQPVMTSCFNGTSAATPYAAGVAALLAQAKPDAAARAVGEALTNTGEAITDARNSFTRNLVNAPAALVRLQQGCPLPDAPTGLASNPTAICKSESFTVSWGSVTGAESYTLQAANNSIFTDPDTFQATGTSIALQMDDDARAILYLRVRANVACGSSSWSATLSLRYTPQCGLPPNIYWLSGIARTPGFAPAVWYSDVSATNPNDIASDVTLTFYGSSGSLSRSVSIGPHQQVSWENIVQGLFAVTGNDVGALKVESTEPAMVVARTYSQVSVGSPTFGQEYVGMAPSQALTGTGVGYLPNLRSDAPYYTNLEFVNVSGVTATVEAKLYDNAGVQVGTVTRTISPNRRQSASKVLPSGHAGAWAEVRVTPAEAAVMAFASVIDDQSKDPTTVPLFIPGTALGVQTTSVSGIARWPGFAPAVWYSDVSVLNPGQAAVEVQLTFYGKDQIARRSRQIGARQQATFTNVLQSLFALPANDVGVLVVTSPKPICALARTYSQVSAGRPTYGQGYVGMVPEQALTPGLGGVIPGLRAAAPFYTNLELVNVGAVPATVEVRFFDNSGAQVASLSKAVATNARVGVNKVLPAATGFAYATVRVTTGDAKVIAFASVVDDLSKDPTTMPMFVGPY